MDTIRCPIFAVSQVTPKDFVRFWDRLYSGFDEDFYRANIGQPLTEHRIKKWFTWKNGGPLSAKKAESIRRYSSPEERIDHDADASELVSFLNRPGGTIWRIFWLHIQHPPHFPIYDQHVHRAMAFMLEWPNWEIPDYNPTKVRTYLDFYRPFFDRFSDCDHRQADRAIWSFGRFLSLEYSGIVTLPSHAQVSPSFGLVERYRPDHTAAGIVSIRQVDN